MPKVGQPKSNVFLVFGAITLTLAVLIGIVFVEAGFAASAEFCPGDRQRKTIGILWVSFPTQVIEPRYGPVATLSKTILIRKLGFGTRARSNQVCGSRLMK